MERFVWKGHIKPNRLEEYIEKHQNIWPEMEELMRIAGMRNYSIWNFGNELIGYYEFLGMERKQQAYMAHQDILCRWNAHMNGIMEMDRDENGQIKNYAMIWLME
jgi:L-rhamnose mutarotase